MAEAFARIHGGRRIDAYSAGSHPSGKVNPRAVESMKEAGYYLTLHESKSLDELPEVTWDFVATMGCGDECPLIRARERDDWEIPDPKDMPPEEFRRVRDQIEEKVKSLLSTL